jgi:hypothetical protein
VYDVLKEGKVRTADLGGMYRPLHRNAYTHVLLAGNAKTTDVTKAIIDKL